MFNQDFSVRLLVLFGADPDLPVTLVMHLHVIAERGLARKVLLADLALEGLLASVDPEMVVKMAPVVELAATLLAFKRPLTYIKYDEHKN